MSPRQDHPLDVASKIDVYLRGGSTLVLIIDPHDRSVIAHDAERTTVFSNGETFRHAAFPGFSLELAPFFADSLDSPLYRDDR